MNDGTKSEAQKRKNSRKAQALKANLVKRKQQQNKRADDKAKVPSS